MVARVTKGDEPTPVDVLYTPSMAASEGEHVPDSLPDHAGERGPVRLPRVAVPKRSTDGGEGG